MSERFDYCSLTTREVPCPICREHRFETLCVADRYRMGIVTSGCLGCGLVMTNPRPEEGAIADFYLTHYRSYYQSVTRPSEQYIRQHGKDVRAAHTGAWIAEALGDLPVKAILDLGTAEGSLLHVLGSRFPMATRDAVEPSPEFRMFAAAYAQCQTWPSLDDIPAGRRFDVVIVNHVLEHTLDPVVFLRTAAARLEPDGRLYVDVPSIERYRTVESLHIAHLFHFSASTLRRAATSAGLRIVRIEAHSPPHHPPSIRALLAPEDVFTLPAITGSEDESWRTIRSIGRWSWLYHLRGCPHASRIRRSMRRSLRTLTGGPAEDARKP
jgi:SAM-dependent methyltransferase